MTIETARAAQGQHDKAALIARIKAKRPITTHVDIVDNDDVGRALLAVREEHSRVELFTDDDRREGDNVDPKYAESLATLHAVEAEYEAACTRLHFRGIPRDDYEHIISSHPPTDAQVEDAEKEGAERPMYDVDAVLPIMISACSWLPPTEDELAEAKAAGLPEPLGTQPLFTPEEVVDLIESWNQAEVERVWQASIFVNTATRSRMLPKGSGTTRG